MAAWLTVYCSREPPVWTPEELLAELRRADWWTLSEDHQLPDGAVELALGQLGIEACGEGPFDLELRYAGAGARPLVLHAWTGQARVAEELEEAREIREPPAGVDDALDQCTVVFGIEMGWSQLADMGAVFGWELARLLAQRGRGVVVDDDHEWFRVTCEGPLELVD
jgi:hypothetical protein